MSKRAAQRELLEHACETIENCETISFNQLRLARAAIRLLWDSSSFSYRIDSITESIGNAIESQTDYVASDQERAELELLKEEIEVQREHGADLNSIAYLEYPIE